MASMTPLFPEPRAVKTFEGAKNRVLKAVKELNDNGWNVTIKYMIAVTEDGLFYPIVTVPVNTGGFSPLMHFFIDRNICVTGI